jgi:hypothetical protein
VPQRKSRAGSYLSPSGGGNRHSVAKCAASGQLSAYERLRKFAKMDSHLAEILSSIDELATRGRINRNRALAAWFAISFFDVEEDDALEAAAADGGNDQGIDLVFPDDTSQEIVVIQAYCPENFGKVTPKNKWDAAVASIPFVRDPTGLRKAGRPDLAEAISIIRKTHPEYTIAIVLVSMGLAPRRLEWVAAWELARGSLQPVDLLAARNVYGQSVVKAEAARGGGRRPAFTRLGPSTTIGSRVRWFY